MDIFSSDYFSIWAWIDYFFQPTPNQENDSLFLDFEAGQAHLIQEIPDDKLAELSSEERVAYYARLVGESENRLLRLESEKKELEAHLSQLDRGLGELHKKRAGWEKRQKTMLPDVLKDKSPQVVFHEKQLQEIDKATIAIQREKAECMAKLQATRVCILQTKDALAKLQAKSVLSQ